MKKIKVSKEFANKSLEVFVFKNFPYLKKSTYYKALRKKDIRVNDVKISENVNLNEGDEVTIYIVDELLLKPTFNVEIIYEDDNILIVNKPSQIEVTGDNSLTSYLKDKLKISYLMPCHRIDRNTLGLVLFAKNKESLNVLLDKFKNHEIEKHYLALCYGIPKNKEGILTAYLFKDNKKSMVYISPNKAKGYNQIITKYILLGNKEYNINGKIEKVSLLDVSIKTGRTHQIRAHLAYIGLPIIGDGKYGINQVNKEFKQKTQMLESYKLKFTFTEDASILNYLNNREFSIKKPKISLDIKI